MKYILFFTIFLLCAKQLSAQNNEANYRTQPLWVAMIDDPGTNYYEALKAYKLYWENRIEPDDEEEAMDRDRIKGPKDKAREAMLAKMMPAEKANYDRLKYQCKRFEGWKKEVRPFVQEDGRILTIAERIAIREKQIEESKPQNR
ncbi:MAG: hypothetical protein JNJ58_11915 [Chitinophagaceae bacterium]|nr:hypothetical protein [Chitinophagaceae bacterium]